MADESTEEVSTLGDEDVILDVPKATCGQSTAVKTLRLGVNLFTNALIFVTVFVCLVYACRPGLTIAKLHIILCVLGYQLFMSQGVMALSQYNGWTVLLKPDNKFHVHLVLQLIATAMVVAGTVLYMLTLDNHFTTLHGGFGIVAAGASALSLVNGLVAWIVNKCASNVKVKRGFKIYHATIGLTTLIVAAVSLCLGFEYQDFKDWTSRWFNNDQIPVPVLQLMTGLFTFSIALGVVIPEPGSSCQS